MPLAPADSRNDTVLPELPESKTAVLSAKAANPQQRVDAICFIQGNHGNSDRSF